MEIILDILIFLTFLIPILSIWNDYKENQRLIIDHKILFTFGFLFYWIVPIIIGVLLENVDINKSPSVDLWYSFYSEVNTEKLCEYLFFSLMFYLFFLFGTWFGKRKLQTRKKWTFFTDNMFWLKLFLWVCIGGFFCYSYILREYLFTGYVGIADETYALKSSLVAFSLLFLDIAMLYTMGKENLSGNSKSFFRLINNEYMFCYFISAIIVTGLGGRLYLVSSIVMIFVYYTVYYSKKISRKQCLYIILFILISGGIGVLRQSSGDELILESITENVFLEPLFTSISLFGFIQLGNYEWLEIPIPLMSSFINLIPKAIFPEKQTIIITGSDLGYYYNAPLGATHSFYSYMCNFGILGSLIAIFIFGFLMNRLKSSGNILGRTIYVMLSGFCLFTFFRDGFATSIIKNMFQFSVVMPSFIICFIWLVSKNKDYSDR